jgi:mannosyltransferase
MGLWETSRPSPWTDEIVTMDVSQRSLTQITHLLGTADAVHGLYYFLIRAVTWAFGLSVFAVRLPSIIAVAAAAAGVALLARRLGGDGLAAVAGPLFALAPTSSRYAQEARPFALVMAFAVFATLALAVALERSDRRWYVVYACLIAVMSLGNILSLLLIPAHALTLVLVRVPRATWRRWLIAAGVAVVPVLPLLWLAFSERGAVGIASFASPGAVADFAGWLFLPEQPSSDAVVVYGLVGLGLGLLVLGFALVVRVRIRQQGGGAKRAMRSAAASPVLAFALPWLVIPLLGLTVVSVAKPIFTPRYLLYCLPAAALLVSFVLSRIRPAVAVSAALLLAMGLAFVQVDIRQQDSRPWDTKPVAQTLAARDHAGDGILYGGGTLQFIASAFPQQFSGLRDIGTSQSAAVLGTLAASRVPEATLVQRLGAVSRVWVLSSTHLSGAAQSNQQAVLAQQQAAMQAAGGFTVAYRYAARGLLLTLYVRATGG